MNYPYVLKNTIPYHPANNTIADLFDCGITIIHHLENISSRFVQRIGNICWERWRYAPTTDHKSKFKSPSKTVGAIVWGNKSAITKQSNQIRATPGLKVWQRNYYEHIIRNEKSSNQIRDCILNNPASWEEDQNHPDNFR